MVRAVGEWEHSSIACLGFLGVQHRRPIFTSAIGRDSHQKSLPSWILVVRASRVRSCPTFEARLGLALVVIPAALGAQPCLCGNRLVFLVALADGLSKHFNCARNVVLRLSDNPLEPAPSLSHFRLD
jgi:hypothetical protein